MMYTVHYKGYAFSGNHLVCAFSCKDAFQKTTEWINSQFFDAHLPLPSVTLEIVPFPGLINCQDSLSELDPNPLDPAIALPIAYKQFAVDFDVPDFTNEAGSAFTIIMRAPDAAKARMWASGFVSGVYTVPRMITGCIEMSIDLPAAGHFTPKASYSPNSENPNKNGQADKT